ncbi:hypothetical protein [Metallosphaera cuprina]|uniref:Uncharacterized protein n=1 Tax=Metallosphaera cuprina (strain Ar-4) TaxID=1006006 RepID=F4FZC9_METCR|nr:hypothetical protein [Metallosphaera cuprina]AEB94438.1 conserved hypothetical protein [Metallosphaera cuprina Ar-4]
MRISETTNKYLLKKRNHDILIEEIKNERGETLFVLSAIKSAKLPDGESWSLNTSDYKELDRKNLSPEIKKLLSSMR